MIKYSGKLETTVNEPNRHTGPSLDGNQGLRSGPSVQSEQQAEKQPRPAQFLAYGVVALLYLSFLLHVANSQAVTAFIAEVTRLLDKFVY